MVPGHIREGIARYCTDRGTICLDINDVVPCLRGDGEGL